MRDTLHQTPLEINMQDYRVTKEPFYLPVQDEVKLFEIAYESKLPLMLKGPTGCGKTRFVEAMAVDVGCPLCTVACHDDTSATDLLGRYLVEGGDTVWQDGPLTRAVREGAILYLDEVTEAREDIVVVLHSLTDHRRQTPSHLVHSLAQLYARLWY
jgi:nitric oxide reductase NorQ protein